MLFYTPVLRRGALLLILLAGAAFGCGRSSDPALTPVPTGSPIPSGPRAASGDADGVDLAFPSEGIAPAKSPQWMSTAQMASKLAPAVGFPAALTTALGGVKGYYLDGKFAHTISTIGTLDERRALSYYMFGSYGRIELQTFTVKFDSSVTGSTAQLAAAIAQAHNLTIVTFVTLADNDYYVFRVGTGFGLGGVGGGPGGGGPSPANPIRGALAALADQILLAYPEVDAVEPVTHLTPGSIPNDARVEMVPGAAWQVIKVSAPEVWPRTQGEGILTAVFDTGVHINSSGGYHQDLNDRIELLAGYDYNFPALDPEMQGKQDVGVPSLPDDVDYSSGDDDDYDFDGHGTSVAGTIAAKANNSVGGAGIAPQSMIVPFKIFYMDPAANYRHGKSLWVGQAAKEAVDIKREEGLNIRIANWSIYGYEPEDPFDEEWWDGDVSMMEGSAIHLMKAGILVIGINGYEDDDAGEFPGIYESVVAVAPLNFEDKSPPDFGWLTDFTDIYAPGDEMAAPTATSDSSYTTDFSGGSAAAPVVSGVYALHLAANSHGGSSLPSVARAPSFNLIELLVLMQNFAFVLGNAKPITADVANTDFGDKLAGRVDAGYLAPWRQGFVGSANSADFVVFDPEDSTGLKLFNIRKQLDANGAHIGNDPQLLVYDGTAWTTETVPGPSQSEPAETLIGIDTTYGSALTLHAMVARAGAVAQTVEFYESQRGTNGNWSDAVLVHTMTGHTAGPLPVGLDYDRTTSGSYAICKVSYLVGGYNSRFFATAEALPGYAGEAREVESAPGSSEVLFYTAGASGKELWRRFFGNWWEITDDFAGTEELIGLGSGGSMQFGRTGWASWRSTGANTGAIKYRLYRNGNGGSLGSFTTKTELTDAVTSQPAQPQRIDIVGNADDEGYVVTYSDGVYGTLDFRYFLISGYRHQWGSGPSGALETMWHRRYQPATPVGDTKDLFNCYVDKNSTMHLMFASPKDAAAPIFRYDAKTLNLDS